jgi:hypothetical protein
LGLYIPCKKVDTWWPPEIKDQMEQDRLFIITLQETCTWIIFWEKNICIKPYNIKIAKNI